ncbi:MAG: precorrin-2 C(20)-methyltransferase [Synechocystis sp.]|nr:precorrin-2 C(20)-methyltransferase [Synechocystis sp.]
MTIGTLTGISVGPGDPDLITLKGLTALQAAAVVAFPAGLQGRSGIAETIIAPHLLPQQIQLPLHFPYVQTAATLTAAWERAAEQVWAYLEQGLDVAFACEGDISFYSTFTYLAQTLQTQHPGVNIQRIAGVSSPLAAASALQMPLVCQDQRLAVLPALYDPQALVSALEWADVIVLMKVRLVYETVWQILGDRHLLDRAWVIERISTGEERSYHPLSGYPELTLSYFSLMLIYPKLIC